MATSFLGNAKKVFVLRARHDVGSLGACIAHMKGLKIIRTSNWDAMTTFYRDKLGMNECDHDSKDSLHQFADFGTEIHLERVGTEAENELLGSLELYSSDPDRLASHLSGRGITVNTRPVGGRVELMFSDPDGHILTIVSETLKT